MQNVIDMLDASGFRGLMLTNCHTGYNASVQFEEGKWSPRVFAGTASEAIEKVLRLHGRREVAPAPTLAPPPY